MVLCGRQNLIEKLNIMTRCRKGYIVRREEEMIELAEIRKEVESAFTELKGKKLLLLQTKILNFDEENRGRSRNGNYGRG